jgi:hypothetical protein
MKEVMSEETADRLWEEYTSMRRIRSKGNAFLDPAGVKKNIIVMYKDLFGVDIINTKRTTKKNKDTGKLDKKTLYSMNTEYYEKMRKVYFNSCEEDYKPEEVEE